MFHHAGFRVRDLAAARRFYEACAGPIGLAVADNGPDSFLVCRDPDAPFPFLWIGTTQPAFWEADHRTSASPVHVAFDAPDRAAVDAFHAAGLAAGGRDNGKPGLRAGGNWYAAFLLDPDGNNIEAGVAG